MTLPPVVRVFFAIDLPLVIKEVLSKHIANLKKRSKSNYIRWTRPENLHITLQFLPEVKRDDVGALLASVKERLQGVKVRVPLAINEIHLFPNPFRPRVIVLDISPQDEMAALSKTIGEAITKVGYTIEDRPFRAHLTIGRIKQPKGVNLAFLEEVPLPDLDPLSVTEVVLFRSEPQADGSQYSVLERVSLLM